MDDKRFCVTISINDNELADIMRRLDEAKETIYECYQSLGRLGVLQIEKDTASDN